MARHTLPTVSGQLKQWILSSPKNDDTAEFVMGDDHVLRVLRSRDFKCGTTMKRHDAGAVKLR